MDRPVIPGAPLTVILALRQYPQGGRVTRVNKSKPTDRIPLSLDVRGIKGEGDSKTVPSYCLEASMTAGALE